MARVLPFQERQDDPAETPTTDLVLQTRPAEFSLLQLVDVQAALNQSHAELTSTAWIRSAVLRSMQNKRFRVQARDVKGGNPNSVYIIILDENGNPTDVVDDWREGNTTAAWSPPASPSAKQVEVLSWTTKMGCPSFSLPAGPIETGGSCPGAAGGQSIIGSEKLKASQKFVETVTGEPVRLYQAICQFCYAEGGQYATGGVQVAQVLRYIWTRDATSDVRFESSGVRFGPKALAWIEAMVYAIDNADFMLEGGKVAKLEYPPERARPGSRKPARYFRWHDSGDLFSAAHLALVKEVCNRLPDITFWTPTRCWATSWGVEAVNKINGPAEKSNLVIRPSAYHVNEPPPSLDKLGPGWAAGSTSYALGQKLWAQDNSGLVQIGSRKRVVKVKQRDPSTGRMKTVQKNVSLPNPLEPWAKKLGYDWDCQTYAVDDEKHTCRHAMSPELDSQGRNLVGCRACWIRPSARINYTLH